MSACVLFRVFRVASMQKVRADSTSSSEFSHLLPCSFFSSRLASAPSLAIARSVRIACAVLTSNLIILSSSLHFCVKNAAPIVGSFESWYSLFTNLIDSSGRWEFELNGGRSG